MRVRLSPRAYRDLSEIQSFVHERSPSGARNVMGAIRAALQVIREQPYASEATERANVRVCVVRRYPYKIFYRIDPDVINVLHVRHSARRPWLPE